MGGPLYLYHTDNNNDGDSSNNNSPIIEHLVPLKKNGAKNYNDAALYPDFLYEPISSPDLVTPHAVQPARVVEFYAPWCPHCKHFAPQYKKLAAEIQTNHPEIKFYAVSCVAHHDLCKAQKVSSYPTMKYFRKGSYNVTIGLKKDANSILKELGYDADNGGDKGSSSGSNPHNKQDKEIARVIPFQRHDVHDAWSDAALSFEFALKNNIYMENGPLSTAKSDALREWLALLSKSLPAQMKRTHILVDALLNYFDEATRGQTYMNQLVRRHVKEMPSWSWQTCTYGENDMGYTCGLWQLFHVMSVGVVEYNRHNIDAPIATGHASETLRNYIDHFFQCDVCRMNFLSQYDSCAFDGCHRLSERPSLSEQEWREFPLWLWETHNDVNVRLLGERLEQNKMDKPNQWESQQARWPNLFMCPNCWREDHSWDESDVFDHLHSLYWSGDPSYIKIQSNDAGSAVVGGASSRGIGLRWKISGIIFVVAAVLMRLSSPKNGRRNSGKRKK